MTTRLVISLGGNAFAGAGEQLSMSGQFAFAAHTLSPLAGLMACLLYTSDAADESSRVLVWVGGGGG